MNNNSNPSPQPINIWSGNEEFSLPVNFPRGNNQFNVNKYMRERNVLERERLEKEEYNTRKIQLNNLYETINSPEKIQRIIESANVGINSSEKMLRRPAVSSQKPIVKLNDSINNKDIDQLINQIFLYDSIQNINQDNIDIGTPVGIVEDDKSNKYLVYQPIHYDSTVIPCPVRELYKNTNENNRNLNIQCNKTERLNIEKSHDKMTRWSRVLQRYPELLKKDDWYVSTQSGAVQAILGTLYTRVVDYNERKILLLGEIHNKLHSQCIPKYTINNRGDIVGKPIQPLYKDPYFQTTIIKHIAHSTQETIDVYLEVAPVTEEIILINSVDGLSSTVSGNTLLYKRHTLPITSRKKNSRIENTENIIRRNIENTNNLRVHGSDIRFKYNKNSKLREEMDFSNLIIFFTKDITEIYRLFKNIYLNINDYNIINIIYNYCEEYNKSLLKNNKIQKIEETIHIFLQNLSKNKNYTNYILLKELLKLQSTNYTDFLKLMHYIYLFYKFFFSSNSFFYSKWNQFKILLKRMFVSNKNSTNFIRIYNDEYTNIQSYFIQDDIHLLIIFQSLLMDTYTISRMLSKFNRKKELSEKYRMNTSINSIYIAGAAHCYNILNFFESFNNINTIDQIYSINNNIYEENVTNIDNHFKGWHDLIEMIGLNNTYNPILKFNYCELKKKFMKILTTSYTLTINRNNQIIIDKINELSTLLQEIYDKIPEKNENTCSQKMIQYAPLIQTYNTELIQLLLHNVQYSDSNYKNELEQLLELFKKNWPIGHCQQLTDNLNIQQPIFVRYGKPYLVGVKINPEIINLSGGRIKKLWRRMQKLK
jgi:hypothetical protein